MERITINSKVTAEDYKKVVWFGAFGKNKWIKPMMFLACAIGMVQILTVLATGRIDYPITFSASLVLFGLIVLIVGIINWDANRFIKTKRIAIDITHTIYMEEQGVVSLRPNLEQSTIGYDEFCKAYEIKGYFLLYIDQLQAVILAKRDVKEADLQPLRQLLSDKLGNRFEMRSTK